jgi:uncharacterized membrane protein YdjX (TVP38/TMEM64 family)
MPARTIAAAAAIAAGLFFLFLLAHALDLPLLSDETPALGEAGPVAAIAGVALLIADVVLPVPSSGVMLANGALFGAMAGAALSLAGSMGAAALGWWVGRRGGRLVPASESPQAALLAERGGWAVTISRPVPVLAETVAIMAGAVGMPLRRLLPYALLGAMPPAVGYGVVGAAAGASDAALPVFAAVLAVSACAWVAGRRRRS